MLWIRTGGTNKSRKRGIVWRMVIEGLWWWKLWKKKIDACDMKSGIGKKAVAENKRV